MKPLREILQRCFVCSGAGEFADGIHSDFVGSDHFELTPLKMAEPRKQRAVGVPHLLYSPAIVPLHNPVIERLVALRGFWLWR